MKDLLYVTGWTGKSHLCGMTNLYHPLLRGYVPLRETNYHTLAFAWECTNFISRHTTNPFFLYAPFNVTHFPLQTSPDLPQRCSTNDFAGNLNRDRNCLVESTTLLGPVANRRTVARMPTRSLTNQTLNVPAQPNASCFRLRKP